MTEEQKKYFDAKKDAIQAAKSFSELTPQQKEQLAKELLGTEAFIRMCNIMRKYFG